MKLRTTVSVCALLVSVVRRTQLLQTLFGVWWLWRSSHNLFIINLRFLFQRSCSRTKTHCPYPAFGVRTFWLQQRAEESVLQQVQVVFRHGDRSAIQIIPGFENADWWECYILLFKNLFSLPILYTRGCISAACGGMICYIHCTAMYVESFSGKTSCVKQSICFWW